MKHWVFKIKVSYMYSLTYSVCWGYVYMHMLHHVCYSKHALLKPASPGFLCHQACRQVMSHFSLLLPGCIYLELSLLNLQNPLNLHSTLCQWHINEEEGHMPYTVVIRASFMAELAMWAITYSTQVYNYFTVCFKSHNSVQHHFLAKVKQTQT